MLYYTQGDLVFGLYLSSNIKEKNSGNPFPASCAMVARHLWCWIQ